MVTILINTYTIGYDFIDEEFVEKVYQVFEIEL